MGMTLLKNGSMWYTMPCHTHNRSSEVCFGFEMPEDGNVFHFMGEPQENRHLVVRGEQSVIFPSRSIRSGYMATNNTAPIQADESRYRSLCSANQHEPHAST
ncbi:5-deoxy-glucuronate isomerase [Paenibacillus sp. RU4T]|uniref:5-deoxy-glucuronate isomerase n=1 Tax=Paenibacillus sp. RU4T TaxID=1907394 RepID=UPI0009706A7A